MSSYLPEEILQEIFSRLPWKSVLRLRCVNKFYCALFDSSKFKNMHHELSNIRIGTSIMFNKAKSKEEICTIDYKSVSSLFPLSTSSTTMCEFVNLLDYSYLLERSKDVKFLSSCNGLVWICFTYNDQREEYYIWNPTTKVYCEIPTAVKVKNDDIRSYGFGYDYKTDNYKLIRVVVDLDSRCSNVDVYTLRSSSWRRTQSTPYYLYYTTGVPGVFFNGAFHWLACLSIKHPIILVCFDIVDERFEEVALPETPMPYPEEPLEEGMFRKNVGILGGCLCLVYHVFNVRVDVWMMQVYGVRESWSKSFSISQESLTTSTILRLIWSFKNHQTLWRVDQGFVLYDPNTKRYRKLMLDSRIIGTLSMHRII